MSKIIVLYSCLLCAFLFFFSCHHKILTGVFDCKVLNKNQNQTWYEAGYEKYRIDSTTLQPCAAKLKDLEYLVFLGTWCSDSREHAPAFFKIADSLNLPVSKLIFLDRQKKGGKGLETQYQIEYVPTFIVLNKNGNEIGRIVETPAVSLEADLCKIISEYN